MLDALLYRGAERRLGGRVRVVQGTRVYERASAAAEEGAPAVVLVHGIGVSGRYLLPTAARLAEHCVVHVPDLPGFGRSGRLRARPTVRRLADALVAWLDAAGLERADALVANSFGCQVVLELAARRPERVDALVLVGPTVDRHARSLGRQAVRLAVDATREPAALSALQAFDYAVHLAKAGPAGFVEMIRDAPERKAPHVRARTLVVRGSRDPIVPRRWAEELVRALPCGRLVEIAGAPHAVNYAAPDELSRLILELVARGRDAAPAALHSER